MALQFPIEQYIKTFGSRGNIWEELGHVVGQGYRAIKSAEDKKLKQQQLDAEAKQKLTQQGTEATTKMLEMLFQREKNVDTSVLQDVTKQVPTFAASQGITSSLLSGTKDVTEQTKRPASIQEQLINMQELVEGKKTSQNLMTEDKPDWRQKYYEDTLALKKKQQDINEKFNEYRKNEFVSKQKEKDKDQAETAWKMALNNYTNMDIMKRAPDLSDENVYLEVSKLAATLLADIKANKITVPKSIPKNTNSNITSIVTDEVLESLFPKE